MVANIVALVNDAAVAVVNDAAVVLICVVAVALYLWSQYRCFLMRNYLDIKTLKRKHIHFENVLDCDL